eukprot:scaffold15227_cov70-Cyclotella_meneghiniana.AAC.11
MTRNEVLTLIKTVFKQAKLGVQNTKDSLMIGRTPYRCLGCSQLFPNGVNGMRAPKINHDSMGPFNIPPVLHSASRRSLRPLRTPIRPSTAIIGGGFGSRHSTQPRTNSR